MIRPRIAVLACLAGLFAWLFADALFGKGVFAFRDSGHFYYPLFQFIQSEWARGHVPLWNPYENLGMPLAGNAAGSVFYPGKLIFALPLDYAWAYKLYIMGHVLLAAWAAYRLARRWGASIEAAGVASLSYAFCGNVLFQYCNVIFLVGAAWLPLAVLAADRMLVGRSVRAAIGFGAVLALITLGGNAEMAYHAGLLAAILALWLWKSERSTVCFPRRPAADSGGTTSPRERCADEGVGGASERFRRAHLLGSRPVLLAVACATAVVLSAVQSFPSWELTRRSGRTATPVARTIYEVPANAIAAEGDGNTSWADGLTCRRIPAGSHHEHVYHFSVGPWRLLEYVWPNVSGRQFPIHRRWIEVIPAEGRIWVPSFYMGLVPLALALASMRFWRTDARTSWLSWIVLLSVLGSFGWYGMGWLVREIGVAAGGGAGGNWTLGPPFGGLYWLMTVILPVYIYFRFPAKLLVITALGLSMLAAAGWDRAFAGPARRLRCALVWLSGFSLAGAIVALALRPYWHDWLSGVPPDVLFGPLDTAGAHHDLVTGLLQTAVVAAVAWWLLWRSSRGARWSAPASLVLVAVDLAVANGWMVACAPAESWQGEPALAKAIGRREIRDPDSQPYRVARHSIWLPASWRRTSSCDRLTEALLWDHHTLWPKHNLPWRIAIAESQGTMMPYDYELFAWAAKQVGLRSAPQAAGVPWILAKYAILPEQGRAAFRNPSLPEDVSLEYHPDPLPRSWIVHDVEVLPPLRSNAPAAMWRRTEEALSRDLRRTALVETASPTAIAPLAAESAVSGRQSGTATAERPEAPAPRRHANHAGERCRIVRYESLRVDIEAHLEAPGLVVLCDQFYPGWRLDVETAAQGIRRVPILRANRVMRGAWLPAGSHRLVYRYRPPAFLWGAAVSSVGWAALAVAMTFLLLPRAVDRRLRRSARADLGL